MVKNKQRHAHDWNFIHTVYEGRTEGEAGIVRFCMCGERRVAYVKDTPRYWHKVPAGHDAHAFVDERTRR